MDTIFFAEMVDYYNFDRGVDLLDVSYEVLPSGTRVHSAPFRAVCANIAWCLLDKERFEEYYNASDFWRQTLGGVLNHYLSGAEVDRVAKLSVGFTDTLLEAYTLELSNYMRSILQDLSAKSFYNLSHCQIYLSDVAQMLYQMLHPSGVLDNAKEHYKARHSGIVALS